MALTLPGIPSLLPPRQFSRSCEHQQQQPGAFSAAPSRKCATFPCIHCNAQPSDDSPAPHPHSWAPQSESPSYAGWSFLDPNNKRKKRKFPGFLQVGAGVALAVGFAAVSHAFSKRGVGTVVVSAPSVYQENIIQKVAEAEEPVSFEQTKASDEEFDLHATSEDVTVEKSEPEAIQQQQLEEESTPSTGQVSLPSQKNEERVSGDDDGVSSPASAGAASTLENENAGGEVSSESEPGVVVESSSSPADTTAEHTSVSDESLSLASENDEIALIMSGAAAASSEPEVSGEATPGTDEVPGESQEVYSESNSPAPGAGETTGEMEPVVVLVSEMPAAADAASGDFEMREVLKCAIPAKLSEDEEIEVVVSVASPGKVGASPVENDAAAPDVVDDEGGRVVVVDDKVSSPSESELWQLTSVVVPAPCAPSALESGRVLIPPVVDHPQEQAVAALQSLKVVEPGVGAADICTRREYARWLVAANRTLAKSSAAKVVPAMFIEGVTEIAFDDVSPNDPDFPFIQGLAEAGLIASKLSQDTTDGGNVNFLPDRPLSRQDLLSWKLVLDHHSLPVVDRNKLQEKTGFIDVDQIHKDAWPAVAADFTAGDRSIIASTFGYTRRFQPHKPVTTGQAAVALVAGEATEQVLEELERLEAEKLAEKAVAAEIALEARAKKEANAVFQEELESQRKLTAAAEARAEALMAELEEVKRDREDEKFGLLKERASLEAAQETLAQARIEVDGLLQQLSSEKVQVVFERGRLEKLVTEIEEERDSLDSIKSETEVEKKALMLAREWAEEEAKKARAHAKVLEEARKRWETQGIEVHVDKELADSNIPVPSWQFNGEKFELEINHQQQKAPMKQLLVKADEYKGKSVEFFKQALEISNQKLSIVQQRVLDSVGEIGRKAQEIQRSTFFVVRSRAGEARGAAASMASGLSALVTENTHKFADGFRGSAEKLAQIFKS